jgi:hypothetical protein
MQSEYKTYHYIISVIVSFIGFLFAIGYGWTAYGTVINRGGMNYSGYNYYNTSKEFWLLYLITIALASLVTPIILLKMFIKKSPSKHIVIVWISFLIIFLIEKICLILFYVGKG